MRISNSTAAIWTFALFVVVNSLYDITIVGFPIKSPDQNDICEQVKRFERVKSDLPHNDEIIGYVSDSDVTQLSHSSGGEVVLLELQAFNRFAMAQYAVVPAIMTYSADHPLLLVNFLKPESAQHLEQMGLEPIKKYGDGLFICKHK